jgi:hypothetical protein
MKKTQHIVLPIVLVRKVTVVLNLREKSRLQLIQDARTYVDGLIKNTQWFPYPNPTVLFLQSKINDLVNASLLVPSRAVGTVEQAKVAEKSLQLALRTLAAYVENIANMHPDNALAIVASVNMTTKKTSISKKDDFSAQSGKRTGELILTAKAGRNRFTMNFEISLEPDNPLSWRSVQNKSLASVTAKGLVSGARYYARVFRTDKNGTRQIGTVLDTVVN